MLNKVILIGRLVNDIELRYTNDQTPFSYFTIAVNRQGQSDKTDFVSCVAWRKTAELMKQYLNKGSLISVEGRLEVYSTQNDGQYVTRTNVNVQSVQFLETRKTAEERKSQMPSQSSSVDLTFDNKSNITSDDFATNNSTQNNNKFENPTKPSGQFQNDINLDDIEF